MVGYFDRIIHKVTCNIVVKILTTKVWFMLLGFQLSGNGRGDLGFRPPCHAVRTGIGDYPKARSAPAETPYGADYTCAGKGFRRG